MNTSFSFSCWLRLQFLAMAKCKQACLCSFGLTKLFDNCHFPYRAKFHLGTLISAIVAYSRNLHQSTNCLIDNTLALPYRQISPCSINFDLHFRDLASDMDIDASSLTRAMYGNARLDTIEKMAVALGVSVKSLFEPMGDEAVEGFIKIRGKIYRFNCRSELENLLNCKR